MFNAEAYAKMQAAEVEYLIANGWFHHDDLGDCWENDELDRYGVTQGHAVNIQKQIDRRQGRVGPTYPGARLDAGRTAEPKTEIVGTFPPDGRPADSRNAESLYVRERLGIPPEISALPELGWDGKPVDS